MKYAFIFVFLFGCDWWNAHYPADNPIEEIAEQVIEQETGLDIDLSPNSPEQLSGNSGKLIRTKPEVSF